MCHFSSELLCQLRTIGAFFLALQGAFLVLKYVLLCDLCQVWEFRPMLSIRLIVTGYMRSVTRIYQGGRYDIKREENRDHSEVCG